MKLFEIGVQNYKKRNSTHKKFLANKLKELISQNVDKKYSKKLIAIVDNNYERFISCPGSKNKHQPWEGGYLDHLIQTFEYAIHNYDKELIKFLPKHEQYSLSDVLLVLFFHDIEKIFKYVESDFKIKNEYALQYKNKSLAKKDLENKPFENYKLSEVQKDGSIYFPSDKEIFANENGIKLELRHRIGLHYVHGENYGSYDKGIRRQSPLGAAVGNADRFSARNMFNVGYNQKGKLQKYSGPNLSGEYSGKLDSIINLVFDKKLLN